MTDDGSEIQIVMRLGWKHVGSDSSAMLVQKIQYNVFEV